ncbi:MAG TPA: hypothetical protein VFW66_06415 [Gemmatimonadales bacterium]|nr:hypothetical protein [Gemmatimonadales bacterium]
MARSTAYWAANPYRLANPEPTPSAPYDALPALVAERFRHARAGLLALGPVSEQVRFMGSPWGWTWEYAVAARKLCWLHPVASRASGTFTLTDDEERRVLGAARLTAIVRDAVREGQRTGPVKWCWIPFADRRHVDAFLGLVRRKAVWLGEAPSARRRARAE